MIFALQLVLFIVLQMVLLIALAYISASNINFRDYIKKKTNDFNKKEKISKDFKTGLSIIFIVLPILYFMFQSLTG